MTGVFTVVLRIEMIFPFGVINANGRSAVAAVGVA